MGLAVGSGGGADSHWGTRKWEPGRPPVLLNQTWVLIQVQCQVVKEREVIVIKADTWRTANPCQTPGKLLKGFSKAVYRPPEGRGSQSCDPLVHGSLVGEVTGG